MVAIHSKKDHGLLRQAADGTKDANEIVASYRVLSYLFEAFQVSSDCEILIYHSLTGV